MCFQPTCVVCGQVADQVLGWFASGMPKEEIVNRTTELCFQAGMYPEHVCYGVINSYAVSVNFFLNFFSYLNSK
jgi:hypothetical protein